ncbi:MAG: spermidine synthase [Ilumatobacteraceae bacterium]
MIDPVVPAARPDRRAQRARFATAFVLGFVGLALEIAYTRIISFKIFYYYTYFVIGLSLLGLGGAGAVTALSTRLRALDPLVLVRRLAPAAAASGLVGWLVVARLPTDVNLIWMGSLRQAGVQVLLLIVLSVAITAVFACVGALFASLVVDQAADIRRLYSWDLAGAAMGCLSAVPLQATIGPPAMVTTSLVLLVALAWFVGVVIGVPRRSSAVGAVAVVLAVAVGAAAASVEVVADRTKTLRESDTVEGGDWGAVVRVDAVDLGDLKVLHHDGLWGSSIWRYDGTPATTARFDDDNRQIPFGALGDNPSVLIIGAAGGNEIMASLTYGAGHVTAVELNPVTVHLLTETFADYSGHVVDDPRVDYVQGDGRTFLGRSTDEYDLIWFVAPDSYAASNAATSGAFVLSESYLYTREMIETAFDHLSDEGVVVAQFGDFAFDRRPTRTARYLTTARAALADRVERFADHVVLVTDDGDTDFERVSTVMLGAAAFDGPTVDGIRAAAARSSNSTLRYVPGEVRADGLTSDLITSSDDEVRAIVDGYPFDIGPITDDRPFFWHFSPFSSVVTHWERTYEDSEIAIGERLLLVLVGIAVAVSALFLWLPFGLTRRRASAERGAGVGRSARLGLGAYFGLLGLGFMAVEISMIQRFALLLGYPTLSLSVSLFTLLLSTAVGARLSSVIGRGRCGGLWAALAALAGVVVVYLATSERITVAALSWPQWARIAVVIALLAPVGIVLGAFLPTGIDAATTLADDATRGRLVAWCWAVNGFFSVIGSSLTTIVSMTVGFDLTLLLGLSLYLVAVAVPTVRRVGR